MGLFDKIKNISIKCPECGHVVTNFQSKDDWPSLMEVEFYERDNFHSICEFCECFVEFFYPLEKKKSRKISDYAIKFKPKQKYPGDVFEIEETNKEIDGNPETES